RMTPHPSSLPSEGGVNTVRPVAVNSPISSGSPISSPNSGGTCKPVVAVSIIIPTFNNLELTRQCLAAIDRHTPTEHEIIVMVNASRDVMLVFLLQQQLDGRLRAILNE